MTDAQPVEGYKVKEQAKKNKKSRIETYDYSQQKSGCRSRLLSQQIFLALAPSSASVPSSKNMYDQKGKAPGSKYHASISGPKTYPTCPRCGKNHLSECLAEKEGCFGCGQSGKMLKDCPSRQGQGGGNGKAQYRSLEAPRSHPNQQGNSSGTGGCQRENRLYSLQARQDQERSPDVVTSTLRVFDLDDYAFLDPGDTLSFVTPCIEVRFIVRLETLLEPFSVSTPAGYLVIDRGVYRNSPVRVYQKVTSADLVYLEMEDFDIFLGMDWFHSCYALVD